MEQHGWTKPVDDPEFERAEADMEKRPIMERGPQKREEVIDELHATEPEGLSADEIPEEREDRGLIGLLKNLFGPRK
ncbi:MAG: hypothetical protein GYB64_06660 [Chloroflexi bacterium]|nr:hypothetical protein [Chloroflexota bacterium]